MSYNSYVLINLGWTMITCDNPDYPVNGRPWPTNPRLIGKNGIDFGLPLNTDLTRNKNTEASLDHWMLEHPEIQGSFCICIQPMRDGVTVSRLGAYTEWSLEIIYIAHWVCTVMPSLIGWTHIQNNTWKSHTSHTEYGAWCYIDRLQLLKGYV